ncbi:MAG TPA: ribonuclease activity regulator RraA, partial [Acetobacteraceae bacterium]|nr:ribonuclease activity regulator RraA [Acetobacteraceae bacterium]
MSGFSPECLAAMRRVSTATLTTALFKRGLRNVFMQGVRPLGRYGANVVGPAFTLRNIPAREDLDRVEGFANPEHPQRKAIETVPPGHVL